MNDKHGELNEELLSYIRSPNFTDLSEAGQRAQERSLLYRLETTIEKCLLNPGESPKELSRRLPSPELPQLIAEIVIAAA